MRTLRILTAGALLALVGCATAGGDDDDNDIVDPPDSGISVVPDANPNQPDAPPQGTPDARTGTPVSITLSQSSSDSIVAANSVSCNGGEPDFYHADNSYYRSFNLPAMGVTSDLTVTQVEIGIEDATGTGGSQPATLRLHTQAGATLTLASLTQIHTASLTVPNQLTSIYPVSVPSVVVPAGSTLVIELFTPNGQTTLNRFFVGSNNLGETAPTYLLAGDCAVMAPATTASLGFPDMAWVVKVTGTHIP